MKALVLDTLVTGVGVKEFHFRYRVEYDYLPEKGSQLLKELLADAEMYFDKIRRDNKHGNLNAVLDKWEDDKHTRIVLPAVTKEEMKTFQRMVIVAEQRLLDL